MLLTANIFQPLIDVFEAVLKFFHNSVGVPWGWSIVLLTVVIRAVLLPLTVKQFHSMQKLQRIGPEMKALQQKYKEDKQRQQQEIMKLYQHHGVNPFASCLPLLAQFPVFISLYYMLRTSLRHDICPGKNHLAHAAHTMACGPHGGASFLFIPDLTNTATGATLIVLILLYVGTQLASSLMMSSPQMDKTQRRLLLFMPLIFVFIMISMPTGVMVYWITTNTWTIAQQYVIRKRVGPMGPPLPSTTDGPGGGSGGGPGGGGRGSGRGDLDGGSNGSGTGGGLAGLLRGRLKPAEQPAAVGAGSRSRSAPPPPPRKKKKRSGRRR